MEKNDWKNLWEKIRKYVLNKYILTLIIFAVILTFVGEQSLINQAKMSHEISGKEDELSELQERISETKDEINSLNASTENLERYAREHYHMHADNEEVFLVDDTDD